MQSLYEETKFLMRKYNISANKSLGQNFLIDDDVVNNIVDSSEINKEDLVIEIGPGLGTLTNILLQKAGKVIAVELDSRMITILKDRFYLYHNFEIINDDILKIDLNKIIAQNKEEKNFKKVKVVANLPYYITTPIIMKLLEDRLNLDSIIIMIQQEVAQRIIAIPGTKLSGAITYSVYYYAQSESIIVVPSRSFIPEPKVNSQVIKLNIRNKPPVQLNDKNLFFNIIKASFMQRRKTLINALVNSKIIDTKENAKEILKNLEMNENTRGETLNIQEFANLANYVSENF